MRLAAPGRPHLTYCTNVHPGESWAEVRRNIEVHVCAVKERVCPDRAFGVGLRLGGAAARELSDPGELSALRELLAARDLYVFTINGFPYGDFHGTRVKEQVYLPDWLDDERVDYTDRLADILAELLPDGVDGSVSTVPGAFKPRVGSDDDARAMADKIARHAAHLHELRARTGRTIRLALEPEPFCHIETIDETISFFTEHVFAARVRGTTGSESEEILRRHVGVCFDACHMAVEHEPPAASLRALASAGIDVHKIQLSAGLEVRLSGDPSDVDALRPFAEDVYLHQVVERRDGERLRLRRHLDLPDAIAAARAPATWRIHFHVPLHRERLGRFRSTQGYLAELLAILARERICDHLEVETYTWSVLPDEHRAPTVEEDVARELGWVISTLEAAR